MKRLRKPRSVETEGLPNQHRSSGKAWTRYVYLGLLGVFALALLRITLGDYLIMNANGIVLKDRVEIGVEFTAALRAVYVEESDEVERGARIAAIRSLDADRALTALNVQLTQLQSDLVGEAARLKSLPQLVNLARRRYETAAARLRRVKDLEEDGLVSDADYQDAVVEEYEARRDLVQTQADLDAAEARIEGLRPIVERMERTADSFEETYNGGIVKAPVAGTVAPPLLDPGAVVEPGDAIGAILRGDTYALGYIPSGTLYDVATGDDVTVFAGADAYAGRITEVRELAQNVPTVLLNSLGKPERRRVISVAFEDGAPPLNAVVSIKHTAWAWLPF